MHPSPQPMPGDAQAELFPLTWLTSEPIRTVINVAPTGLALLRAVRSEMGQIIDFRYQLVNPILRSLTNHPQEDLFSQPLTTLNSGMVKTGMLARLIQVVHSGQPSQYVEQYQLDGAVGHYDQLYLKSGDGVLMLVQEVTYRALSEAEHQQQMALLEAIQTHTDVTAIRAKLVALISGSAP